MTDVVSEAGAEVGFQILVEFPDVLCEFWSFFLPFAKLDEPIATIHVIKKSICN